MTQRAERGPLGQPGCVDYSIQPAESVASPYQSSCGQTSLKYKLFIQELYSTKQVSKAASEADVTCREITLPHCLTDHMLISSYVRSFQTYCLLTLLSLRKKKNLLIS